MLEQEALRKAQTSQPGGLDWYLGNNSETFFSNKGEVAQRVEQLPLTAFPGWPGQPAKTVASRSAASVLSYFGSLFN